MELLRTAGMMLRALLCIAASQCATAGAAPEASAQLAEGTRLLLKKDKDFFEETVRLLSSKDFKDIFGKDRAQLSSTSTQEQLQLADRQLAESHEALKNLSVEQMRLLVATGLGLYSTRFEECAPKRPAIHTIGWSPTFTFESAESSRPAKAGERAVRIPVEGYDLDPPCISLSITIEGTVPVARYGPTPMEGASPDYYITRPSETLKDGLSIILLEPFIDRLKTGDKVAIRVSASHKYVLPGVRDDDRSDKARRRKAVARRVFIAYETQAYRAQVLKSRIQPDDINAFPLPAHDASALFGPLVARNYFVVRLSVRNTDANAKLISTGMIRASGTAMIDSKVDGEPSFSVPVSVVPHSLQQIYSLITDEEVNQPRHVSFRTLEFVGALAAGAQGVFSFGAQAAKNVALFTGIMIPEGKKLWSDRWPGYQRNVVNYAMPDLMKVPANAVIDHKFLFFSKKELDGLVSDPNLFKPLLQDEYIAAAERGDRQGRAPEAFVIALAFDTLDIRFESMPVAVDLTSREMLRDLISQVETQLRDLGLERPWNTTTLGSLSFSGLTQTTHGAAVQNLTAIGAVKPADGDADVARAVQLSKALLVLAGGVAPVSATSAFNVDLYGSPSKYGVSALAKARTRVDDLVQRMNRGVDPDLMGDEITALDTTVRTSRSLLEFYQAVAAALQELSSPIDQVKASVTGATMSAAQRGTVKAFNVAAGAKLDELRGKRPPPATLEIETP